MCESIFSLTRKVQKKTLLPRNEEEEEEEDESELWKLASLLHVILCHVMECGSW